MEHKLKYKQFYASENQSASEQTPTDSDSREPAVEIKQSRQDNDGQCKKGAHTELLELHQRTNLVDQKTDHVLTKQAHPVKAQFRAGDAVGARTTLQEYNDAIKRI